MEPYKAPNPFPVYVKRAVHSANAEAAWPASAFFPMVVTSTLRPLCKDDSDVPQLQTNLITGKLMSLVQEGPAGEQHLHALCQHFKENENSFTMEPAVLSAFNAFVAWMLFCKDIFFVSQDVDIILFIFDKHKTTSSTTTQDSSSSEVPPPLASLSEEQAVFLHGIQAYRQGRQILEGKQALITDSEMDADNAQKLRAAWESFDPLKPGHHADLEGMIANIGSTAAKDIISSEAVIGLHAAVFKSFGCELTRVQAESSDMPVVTDQTPYLMASKLLKSMTELHGLHDNQQCMLDYDTLMSFGNAMMDLMRVADVPEDQVIDEKLVMNVLSSVKKFSTSDEVFVRSLPEKADDIVKLVKDVEKSPVFQRCLQEALNEVESELQGIKDLALHMDYQSLLDPSDETRMQMLSGMVMTDGMVGMVTVFNKLKVLPNANVMLAECLYLRNLAVLLKSVAALGLERSRTTARKERHVTQAHVNKIITLRGYLSTMK